MEDVKVIFLSYSREDAGLIDELRNHLAALDRRVRVWQDVHDIRAGEKWSQALESAIAQAHIFLFCASPDSIASTFCKQELAQAQKQPHTTVVPIKLRPVAKELLLVFSLDALPKSEPTVAERKGRNGRDRAWTEVVQGLDPLLPPRRDGAEAPSPRVAPYAKSDLPRRDGDTPRSRHRAAGRLMHVAIHERAGRLELSASFPPGSGWSGCWLRDKSALATLAGDMRAHDPHQWRSLGDAIGAFLFPEKGEDGVELWRHAYPRQRADVPGPSLGAFRCRVVSEVAGIHAEIEKVPWRLARFLDRWLVADGWTFETARAEELGGSVSLLCPQGGAVLVVPDAVQPGEASRHVDALLDVLTECWRLEKAEITRYVVVARGRDEVWEAIRGREPAVVYVCARLDAAGYLHFQKGRERSSERAQDVADWFRSPPTVVVLNLVREHGTSVPERLMALGQSAIVAASGVELPRLQRDGRALLHGLFSSDPGGDPVAVVHDVLMEQGEQGTAVASAAVRGTYQEWSTYKHGAPTNPADPWVSLDRHHQRDAVLGRLRDMRATSSHRALAVVGYGDESQGMDRLGCILSQHVTEQDAEAFSSLVWRIPVPPAGAVFAEELESTLRRYLDGLPGSSIGQGLTSAWAGVGAPKRVMPLLWLVWKFDERELNKEGEPRQSLTKAELRAWLDFAAVELHHACPEEGRVISVLSLTTPASKHGAVKATVDALVAEDKAARGPGTFVLWGLESVTQGDIERWLRRPDSGCPPGWADAVARALWAQTGGEFVATVNAIRTERDADGFAGLRRRGEAIADEPPHRGRASAVGEDEVL